MELLSIKKEMPDDYHCNCFYCKKFNGVIFDANGNRINNRRRIGYHFLGEHAHIAKTPFGISMWAVSSLTKENDFVLDPTCGIGTTLVEAKKQNRQALGIELSHQWARYAAINCQEYPGRHLVVNGDVRDWRKHIPKDLNITLVLNNPPYSGDENVSIKSEGGEVVDRDWHGYDNDERNLAFLKENAGYYRLLGDVYNGLGQSRLKKGGHLVIGVKDMVHQKKPYLLHKLIADTIDKSIYEYVGLTLLPHWPRTLFMNTYPKRFPKVKIPLYQTILTWRKK